MVRTGENIQIVDTLEVLCLPAGRMESQDEGHFASLMSYGSSFAPKLQRIQAFFSSALWVHPSPGQVNSRTLDRFYVNFCVKPLLKFGRVDC